MKIFLLHWAPVLLLELITKFPWLFSTLVLLLWRRLTFSWHFIFWFSIEIEFLGNLSDNFSFYFAFFSSNERKPNELIWSHKYILKFQKSRRSWRNWRRLFVIRLLSSASNSTGLCSQPFSALITLKGSCDLNGPHEFVNKFANARCFFQGDFFSTFYKK